MKGLNVYTKTVQRLQPAKGSKQPKAITIVVIFTVGLLLLPVMIVVLAVFFIWKLLRLSMVKLPEGTAHGWMPVATGVGLKLAYRWTKADNLFDPAYPDIDPMAVMVFQTEPHVRFFDGHFTDFKIEREDGIFVQKIELNEERNEIVEMPLYFFAYATGHIEKIRDLKGYELESKGNADDFVIVATGEKEELEIRINNTGSN